MDTQLDWVELPLVVDDSEPADLIYLQPMAGGFPAGGGRLVRSAGPIRLPRRLVGSIVSLIGAKPDESKAYVSLSVDLNNDVQVSIVAVDETGGTPVAGEGSARIAGTVKIDGVAAARDVVVISDDPSGRQVVGEGESAGDGTFDITYTGWGGPVIALALDNYGQAWEAQANLNSGTVVHPTTPNGYVYMVTSAGTTGTEEPPWSTEGSVTDGSVTYEAKPYYRPVASGPLRALVIETDKTELQAALDTAYALAEEDYTADSWAALADAVAVGESVMDNAEATQKEIYDAAQAILLAIEQLEIPLSLPTVIGEAFGGGFYAGDIEDGGQWYKLIVADVEADVSGLPWGGAGADLAGAKSETDGPANTEAMRGTAKHQAGNHCLDYRGGGFSDWYMPARSELQAIYENLGHNKTPPAGFESGGAQAFHASGFYWSSTQRGSSYAWTRRFSDGNTSYTNKNYTDRRVRPVRRLAFTPE